MKKTSTIVIIIVAIIILCCWSLFALTWTQGMLERGKAQTQSEREQGAIDVLQQGKE